MNIYIGTSGYGYKAWKGKFYPKDIPDNKMLNYYSGIFQTVEINNTFYSMPIKETLESWGKEVPADFKFILKAPGEITHKKRLKNCENELKYFLETSLALNKKLYGFLFQLPPNLKKDLTVLTNFIELFPKKTNAAFEFRNKSWFDEEVYDLLKKKGMSLCLADTDDNPVNEITSTATWGYLRLRKDDYTIEELSSWAGKIKTQDWKETFVFFKHEDKAKGTKFGQELIKLVNK